MNKHLWYTIDTPRDVECWIVNPALWEEFCNIKLDQTSKIPNKNILYTEAYIVQFIDQLLFEDLNDKKVNS